MNVFYDETGLRGERGICIALGVFDGVHLAHSDILRACVEYAVNHGLRSFAYTYTNQSLARLKPGVKPLSTLEDRLHAIAMLGIENAIVMEFDEAYASVQPEAFLQRICGMGPVRAIFCGYDYRFGHFGRGDVQMLKQYQEQYGYRAIVEPAFSLRGETVSSTGVRGALARGDVKKAHALLGRPYAVNAELKEGKAALPTELVVPKNGHYVCSVILQEGVYERTECTVLDGTASIPALQKKQAQSATILWIS